MLDAEMPEQVICPAQAANRRQNYLIRSSGQGQDRTVDLPLFSEQSYHALSRQDAERWADLAG